MPTALRKLEAQDLMNPDVLTVPEDMSVRELAAFLLDNQISGAPVVHSNDELVGVVSMTDIVAASADAGRPGAECSVSSKVSAARSVEPSR